VQVCVLTAHDHGRGGNPDIGRSEPCTLTGYFALHCHLPAHLLHDHPTAPSHQQHPPPRPAHTLSFLRPVALSSYPPTPTHDSNAPRRQLDGGVPPAADGRGGGQTHPWQRGALGVRAAERSWWLLAQTTSARRSVQPIPRAQAWSTRPAGQPRRRSPVSTGGVHPSAVGVRDPAVQHSGVRSPGVVVQSVRRSAGCCPPSSVQLSGVQLSGVQPSGVQPSGVQPSGGCPPSVRTRPSPPMLRRWRWGPGRAGRATVTTGTGEAPGAGRAVDGSSDGRGGGDATAAAEVAVFSGRSVAVPGRRVGCGPRRPRLTLSDQSGQAAVGSARRGRLRGGRGCSDSAVAAPDAWLASSAGCATTVRGRRRA
jgi:hypothetical protein